MTGKGAWPAQRQQTTGDPLTGRDSELGAIRRALSGAGNDCGVVICGAAGVARPALLERCWPAHRPRRADQRDHRHQSARPLPLGAFTGSIAETASGSMPDVGRLINSFVAQQRQGKVLIGVDDAHLLDGFRHAPHQLAQTRGPRLVVTLRTGEAVPTPSPGSGRPLLAGLDLDRSRKAEPAA